MLPLMFVSCYDKVGVPYRRYRTFSFFCHAIYPIHLIVSALVYWLIRAGMHQYNIDPVFAQGARNVGWGLGIPAAITVIIFTIVVFSKSDAGRLTRAYLRAKKDRVCPKIEFTDK